MILTIITLANIAFLAGSIRTYQAAQNQANLAKLNAESVDAPKHAKRAFDEANRAQDAYNEVTKLAATVKLQAAAIENDKHLAGLCSIEAKKDMITVRDHVNKIVDHYKATDAKSSNHEICSNCNRLVARFDRTDGVITCANCK